MYPYQTLLRLCQHFLLLHVLRLSYTMLSMYGPMARMLGNRQRVQKSLLTTFGGNDRPTWAAITGASSGIGKAYSLALASRGFNVILIARRLTKLQLLATQILAKYNVQVHIVVSDLSALTSNTLPTLMDKFGQRDIGIVICNAGISDVNLSFTNEAYTRTEAMVQTNCVGMALLVHALLPRMEARMINNVSSTIVTAGALNADVPLASNSLSSGTKAFVRNFTLAVNETTTVEMLCAHPLAVQSEIVVQQPDGFFIVAADVYVAGVLSFVQQGGFRETFGLWQHELIKEILSLWPTWLILKVSRACTPWFASMLGKK